MIITKTPLRIGFVGGGTDIPAYYRNYGGALISAAIDKYIYIIVNKKFDSKIRISYSQTEIVDRIDEIKHPSVREALRFLNIDGGIEILSISDIPSHGTGLGSSSTFLVGLLNALHAYKSEYVSREELASEAVKIEREILREAGGKQDQYMAAFGGINMLNFNENESVNVNPVALSVDMLEKLRSNIAFLYTGINRKSPEIHTDMEKQINEHLDAYHEMKKLTRDFYDALYRMDINSMGEILDRNWSLKKSLSSRISNKEIDDLYAMAKSAGALGGNLIGAGGGGFLVFIVGDDKKSNVVRTLGLREMDFDFDFEGSRIIYFSK
ncbi:kinase [Acidiplasma sp.]|uniref:GHMP family kinase ATP-binding protein n=1 Tax=Acidiplasma sp. TaxID=1872114 RepID=UPI0031684E12